jgi:hypothetical protein
MAAPSQNNAFISLETGRVHWVSELVSVDEEVPDDLDVSDR